MSHRLAELGLLYTNLRVKAQKTHSQLSGTRKSMERHVLSDGMRSGRVGKCSSLIFTAIEAAELQEARCMGDLKPMCIENTSGPNSSPPQ